MMKRSGELAESLWVVTGITREERTMVRVLKEYKCTGFLVIVILIALLMPVKVGESEGSGFLGQVLAMIPFVDKLVHISMFGLLSLVNYLEHRGNPRVKLWAMVLISFAVLTEILQKLSGYRSFDVWDIAADCVGIFLGIWFGRLLGHFFRRNL